MGSDSRTLRGREIGIGNSSDPDLLTPVPTVNRLPRVAIPVSADPFALEGVNRCPAPDTIPAAAAAVAAAATAATAPLPLPLPLPLSLHPLLPCECVLVAAGPL